ncbi:DUF4013 domain-containing protein [Methanobacterium ferruginis]|uniref:DUF4013 domain-containing protein n=1 Tax=Methanobacterium ferruginis TaxID=710191 RepID=UPI002572C442|nr:DUF4013 domain-containing protein [Methanobacterium ferruginis]MCC7552027.1 DUF4013 domain-containing protein [Methanobacterium sp.]BDZ66872.1 hypothetical protein GCM10025860_03200 [Methanobacterium ferruginis]
MDIGEIISDSIKYPSSDWGKVLILGVICIASILIIPIFLVMGYVFRIIKATLAGIDELPEFDEIGAMFIDGLKIFVVGIVYSIPIWIIYGIMLVLGLGMSATYGEYTAVSTAAFGLMAVMYLVLIIVAFIVGLFELMAIANMAYYDGELGAAFRFSEILEHISRIGWGKYIVTLIVISIIGGIGYLIGWLTMFILIGFILLPLVIMPYIMMFMYRAIALIFASSLEGEATE